MEHQEGSFKGIRDTDIYYQAWLPDGDPQGVLILVHGLADHCGRYMNFVDHFVPSGYAVYGMDLLGHGKSQGLRVYVERFEEFTDTLKIFLDMVKEQQPDRPRFLVGHSMGGLIVADYLLKHQDHLSGAVLSAPSVKVPGNVSTVTVLLGKVLSGLIPKAGLLTLDTAGVSRDAAVVEAYVNDPLVHKGKITARMAAEMLKAMKRVSAEAGQITLPVLMVQGGADRLVDPAGTRILFDKVGATDKTLKMYKGLYHELFNEPEHGQVLSYVEGWLASHTASRA
jgi:acylglycerol lipase